MAMTGFFYTFQRPRTARPMGLLKYDPIGRLANTTTSSTPLVPLVPPAPTRDSCLLLNPVRKKVLFLEQKRKGGK